MVQVGELEIGSGKPKICASITETTRKAIIAAADILMQKRIDIVEWRIDFYEDVEQWDMVEETLHRLNMSLGNKPLLVTFRTKEEGGNSDISLPAYRELLKQIAQSGYTQLIDIEVFKAPSYEALIQEEIDAQTQEQWDILKQLIAGLQENVKVIGSYHNFEQTPSGEEMARRIELMKEADVDIVKMAVMPQDKKDVLRLMTFTLEESGKTNKPLITMSMGKLGSISRVTGEAFNSAVTFGSIGQASAPGQLQANRLEEVLDLVHQNYQ